MLGAGVETGGEEPCRVTALPARGRAVEGLRDRHGRHRPILLARRRGLYLALGAGMLRCPRSRSQVSTKGVITPYKRISYSANSGDARSRSRARAAYLVPRSGRSPPTWLGEPHSADRTVTVRPPPETPRSEECQNRRNRLGNRPRKKRRPLQRTLRAAQAAQHPKSVSRAQRNTMKPTLPSKSCSHTTTAQSTTLSLSQRLHKFDFPSVEKIFG